MRSVYLGMFEQTLLTHSASGRKSGAIAVSFMAQSSVIGVLLIGPLLYTQVLPQTRLEIPIWIPVQPAPPPPVTTTQATPRGTLGRSLGRAFVAPARVPTGPVAASVAIDVGPVLNGGIVASTGTELGIGVGEVVLPRLVEAAPIPEVAKLAPVADTKPVRVSGGVLAAKLIKRVVPAYPPLARQSRVSGTVRLLGTVAKDGRIENLRVLDGPPLLRQAALEAVRQWVYSPTILNGQPVEIEAPIEVNFSLN